MNGKKILLDTNVIIYLIKKQVKISDFANKKDTLFLSSISYMETMGFAFVDKEEENFTEAFCNSLEILHLTDDVINETILIRKNIKIKLPDAIIAATAKVYKMSLVTANVKDFEKVEKLLLHKL